MNKRHKKKLRNQKQEHGHWHKIDFEELFSHNKYIQAMIKQMENERGLKHSPYFIAEIYKNILEHI